MSDHNSASRLCVLCGREVVSGHNCGIANFPTTKYASRFGYEEFFVCLSCLDGRDIVEKMREAFNIKVYDGPYKDIDRQNSGKFICALCQKFKTVLERRTAEASYKERRYVLCDYCLDCAKVIKNSV